MKRLSTILIVLGLLIALYPLGEQVYTWYMQERIAATYGALDAVFITDPENVGEPGGPGTPASLTEPAESPSEQPQVTTEAPTEAPPATEPPPPADPKKPVGEIQIPKIKVKLPVMNGATQANMKVGAAWMKETTPIGQNGNTAIAAHRSYTYGRFFNRLDEVVEGDEILLFANGKEYRYVVFKKLVVEPTDVSVLRGNKGESVVTLITCTPIKVATHRLIIQAKLVK